MVYLIINVPRLNSCVKEQKHVRRSTIFLVYPSVFSAYENTLPCRTFEQPIPHDKLFFMHVWRLTTHNRATGFTSTATKLMYHDENLD